MLPLLLWLCLFLPPLLLACFLTGVNIRYHDFCSSSSLSLLQHPPLLQELLCHMLTSPFVLLQLTAASNRSTMEEWSRLKPWWVALEASSCCNAWPWLRKFSSDPYPLMRLFCIMLEELISTAIADGVVQAGRWAHRLSQPVIVKWQWQCGTAPCWL
jgi:hypothetical protein